MYLTHDVRDYRGHGYDPSNVCSSMNLSCMICWKGCPWVCACIVVAVAWLTGSRKLAAVAGSSSRVCSTQQLGQHAAGTEGNRRPSTALRPNSPATAEGSRYFLTKCWKFCFIFISSFLCLQCFDTVGWAAVKSWSFLPLWYRLTWVFLEKSPLIRLCVCVLNDNYCLNDDYCIHVKMCECLLSMSAAALHVYI